MKEFDNDAIEAHLGERDWSALHDAAYEASGQTLDRALLCKLVQRLPERVRALGLDWGFCDTEVRDEVASYVQREVQAFGVVQAWLADLERQAA